MILLTLLGLASSSIKCQETLLPVTKLQRSKHGCNDNVSGNFLHGYWRYNGYWRTHRSFFEIVKSNPCLRARRKDHVELKELRRNSRKPFSKLTYFASGNKYYKGIIRNLSHGGAFIETKTTFSNGDELKLVVPGPNKYFQIRCKVIHFNQTGLGVKFKSVLKFEKLPGTKRYGSQLTM